MNDLDTLRPEVREALFNVGKRCDAEVFDTLTAELLRLTDDCARLVDCINAQPPTRRSLIDRAERAEAELAALKARMKPCARVRDGEVHVYMDTAHEGKEVAVVVVEE